MANINRRQFMARTGGLGVTASLAALTGVSATKAWAADTTGYKAMVCVLFNGGMDHADTILPYDQASWNTLRDVRPGLFGTYNANSTASSRNIANLMQLNADNIGDFGGRQYALPQQLAPLHAMFQEGDLAVVGNVGPLIEPTTRTQMDNGSVRVPTRLFSHNDQQSTWLTLGTEGTQLGWGGQFADAAIASSPGESPTFKAISAGSNFPFLAGETSRGISVTGSGAPEPYLFSREWYLGYTDADDATREQIRQFLLQQEHGAENYYMRDLVRANGRAVTNSKTIRDAFESATPFTTTFPTSSLGRQLQSVAQTIQIQQALNTSRQVFFVNTGGFDTHSNQATSLPALHTNMAASFTAFRDALVEIGYWNDTVLFTASDFGRTTIDNGDGTDHGWGGHHFVMGGAVQGRQLYGTLPSADVGSESYTKSRGRLIPSVSIEQYASTIGSWFGLTNSELAGIFPNLGNFNQSNLGFLGGAST